MSMAVMVVVFIGIVGLLLWWNAALRSRRVTELKEFAAQGGYTWSERDANESADLFARTRKYSP